jgi:hypothetical protein
MSSIDVEDEEDEEVSSLEDASPSDHANASALRIHRGRDPSQPVRQQSERSAA